MAHDHNSSNNSSGAGSQNKSKREQMRQVLNQIKAGMLATEEERLGNGRGISFKGTLWYDERLDTLWTVMRVWGESAENLTIEVQTHIFTPEWARIREIRRRHTPFDILNRYHFFGSVNDTKWR